MNIPPLQPGVHAADLPLESLAANPNLSEAAKIAEVSRQFEAILLRQMLAETRKGVIHSDLTASAPGSEIYDDLINERLADAVSRSGLLGLARSLQGQLTRQAGPPAPASPAPAQSADLAPAATESHHD